MSISVHWYDKNRTIIAFEFVGKWTWTELFPVYDECLRMMDTVDYKLGFIVNLLQSEHIPTGALTQVKRIADVNHPNMGLGIYVGLNPLLRSLGIMFVKLYPQSAQKYPIDFARSIEEAEAKLARWRNENQ